MPIRFRCAYCNQLMGISQRKAGTVVRCPKCAGEIIVPSPEAAPENAPEQQAPVAFDDPKFEQNFPANGSEMANASAPVATAPAPEIEETPEPAPVPPPPAPAPASSGPLGLFLPLPLLLVSLGFVILLVILVFVLGLIIGRHTAVTSDARAGAVCHGILKGAPLNVAGQRGAISVAFQRSHSACIARARSGC